MRKCQGFCCGSASDVTSAGTVKPSRAAGVYIVPLRFSVSQQGTTVEQVSMMTISLGVLSAQQLGCLIVRGNHSFTQQPLVDYNFTQMLCKCRSEATSPDMSQIWQAMSAGGYERNAFHCGRKSFHVIIGLWSQTMRRYTWNIFLQNTHPCCTDPVSMFHKNVAVFKQKVQV